MTDQTRVIQFAYADLISHVFLWLRNGIITDARQLHDLADAFHNISGILGDYGRWIDDQKYRQLYLKRYDEQWGNEHLALERILNERIAFYNQSA